MDTSRRPFDIDVAIEHLLSPDQLPDATLDRSLTQVIKYATAVASGELRCGAVEKNLFDQRLLRRLVGAMTDVSNTTRREMAAVVLRWLWNLEADAGARFAGRLISAHGSPLCCRSPRRRKPASPC